MRKCAPMLVMLALSLMNFAPVHAQEKITLDIILTPTKAQTIFEDGDFLDKGMPPVQWRISKKKGRLYAYEKEPGGSWLNFDELGLKMLNGDEALSGVTRMRFSSGSH